MVYHDKSIAVSALVRHTTGLAELALRVGHSDRNHNEFLPYPDNNFNESIDEHLQRGDKFTIEHIYDRSGRSFVPNVPVHVKSIGAERTYVGIIDFLNPYLYCITTQHGPFEWIIYKRYRHFHELHRALVQFVEAETKRSIHDFNKVPDEENGNPCFPTRNDRMIFMNDYIVRERCKILAEYLNKLLKHPKFRNHPATHEFFEVSFISFIDGLSISEKEGYLLKLSHNDSLGHPSLFHLPSFCNSCKFHHDRKWFVIKDTYLTYIQSDRNQLRFPMLVDQGFMFSSGLRNTGIYNGIKIKNLQNKLVIKCRNKRDCHEWIQHLSKLVEQATSFRSPTANRFYSFAPIRQKQLAYWFINGKPYMEALAKALLTAKEEVFIADWWLSPEIMLIRPTDDETFRLDNLLGKIADEGVRVYVIVFKDVPFTMGLNSLHTKRALIGKSQKGFIKVIRHPDHYPKGGVLLWSHHEKMIIIDQKIAFVGGIDLCFGRWDDCHMRLVDLGDENDRNLKMPTERTAETAQETTTQLNEQASTEPAKSSDHMRTATSAPNKGNDDVKSEGQTYASGTGHHMKTTDKKREMLKHLKRALDDDADVVRRPERYSHKWHKLVRRMKPNVEEDEDEEKPETSQSFVDPSSIIDRKHRYFIGKDYVNLYEKGFESLEKYNEDYIDRKIVPRMPWHDGALVVFGQVARDAARHFIQRWNIHKCEKFHNNESYPFLLPKTYDDEEELNFINWEDFLESRPIQVDAQCVRSVGPWSAGTKIVETSVENAYIEMIDGAQHYIYIENQFFVTGTYDSHIRNQVGDALYQRIERAHKAHETFRVYIFLPLLPGFDSINSLESELFFIMCSTTKGEGSLIKRLEKAGVPVNDYISFFGMRNHDILMGNLVTEIIYVHSKLMIIDDHMVICGSANINDRSLLGNRDSEFCIVINDTEHEPGRLNGQSVIVGKFCSSWRKRIFSMMLGIQFENPHNVDITDPVSDEFYRYFRDVARKNALIYEEVFATLPSDRVRKFDQVNKYKSGPILKDTDPIQAQQKLKDIQGFLVEYPLYFLNQEDFSFSFRTRESVTNPVWT